MEIRLLFAAALCVAVFFVFVIVPVVHRRRVRIPRPKPTDNKELDEIALKMWPRNAPLPTPACATSAGRSLKNQ